jgi:hypothetical protein
MNESKLHDKESIFNIAESIDNYELIQYTETNQEKKERIRSIKQAYKKQPLRNEIKDYLINDSTYHNREYIIKMVDEETSLELLEQMLEWIKLPYVIRDVHFICHVITKRMSTKGLEEIEYLSLIQNNQEAIIIYDSIDLWIENAHYLHRGYSNAKKQKTRRSKSTMTYEHRLRTERHYLERALQKVGTGINRAKKLSQILKFID